ncbi:MAG: hypothetical protein GVX90_03590 [Alphaproteobacteria bacterium]|jgi:hypothetical protein|nr:hypothetical protein [Alphaproteobacteria bacterium]
MFLRVFLIAALVFAAPALAGEADVVDVEVMKQGEGQFRFDVTVRHVDEGWEHYADRWDVVGPDGDVLGSRELLPAHVNEQPFTRSLAGVEIPAEAEKVTIRAHDNVHGLGGEEMTVAVPH